METPFLLAFLVLLFAYVVGSIWARLDPRYLIVGALIVLLAAAASEVAGDAATANVLATFVLLLLVGGVVLLAIDPAYARWLSGRTATVQASAHPAQPPDEGHGSS